jgi:serralysin
MKKLIRLFMVMLAAGGLLTAVFTTFTTATARPAPRTLQQTSFGAYTIDGNLSEWTARQRIDLPSFSSEFQRRVGYALYGTFVDGHYLIAVQSAVPIGPNTTIWLNTDQNPATGYLVFGNLVGASGAEFNINFDASTVPALYSGGAGATLVNSSLPYGLGAGNTLLEIAIPASLIGGSPPLADIDIFLDINDVVYLPRAYFGGEPYTILRQPLPEPANTGEQRIAIVYSDVSAKNWYSERDYTQLYASVQHQAMMSGLPYDLIHDTELLTLTNILRYDALILPFNPNIALANLPRVQQNLLRAVHNYGIGLISSSNFLTNDENDNALLDNYARLRLLFGLDPNAYGGPISATLKADDVSHPVMREYGPGDVVHHYLNENGPQTHFYALFVPETTGTIALSSASLVSLTNHINSSVNTAVWATETGARNVHFGTPQYMGDRNLLWQAIQWVVYGDELAPVNLKLGRQTNLFVSRNDMDQSQFIMEQQFLGSAGVTNKLYQDFLVDWKQRYNFVGSYYLNIGYDFTSPTDSRCYSGNTTGSVDRLTFGRDSDQEGLACTRWLNDNVLSTEPGIVITYTLYLSDGNEIGSHSYTHLPPISGTIANPIGLYTDTNAMGWWILMT